MGGADQPDQPARSFQRESGASTFWYLLELASHSASRPAPPRQLKSDMSDSEPSGRPTDASISRALQGVVKALFDEGKVEELTVKRVRTRAEADLGLSAGFFKDDQKWKQKSHDIIHAAVVRIGFPFCIYFAN